MYTYAERPHTHVKDPVVHIRDRWTVETTTIVSWCFTPSQPLRRLYQGQQQQYPSMQSVSLHHVEAGHYGKRCRLFSVTLTLSQPAFSQDIVLTSHKECLALDHFVSPDIPSELRLPVAEQTSPNECFWPAKRLFETRQTCDCF